MNSENKKKNEMNTFRFVLMNNFHHHRQGGVHRSSKFFRRGRYAFAMGASGETALKPSSHYLNWLLCSANTLRSVFDAWSKSSRSETMPPALERFHMPSQLFILISNSVYSLFLLVYCTYNNCLKLTNNCFNQTLLWYVFCVYLKWFVLCLKCKFKECT